MKIKIYDPKNMYEKKQKHFNCFGNSDEGMVKAIDYYETLNLVFWGPNYQVNWQGRPEKVW